MSNKEKNRNIEIEEAREKRRKRRKRIVLLERGIIALVLVALVVGGSVIAYNMQPEVQLEKQLEEAEECMEVANYAGAIASCEEALKIDATSVKAYNAMAGAYLTQEDSASAQKVLYQGWEVTQDESLLQYYCTVLLNEGVEEINAKNCTYATLEKCITVLEKDPANTDVYTLLDACYERMFVQEAGAEGFFCETAEGCGYEAYQAFMYKLIAAYEAGPTEELKAEVLKYAVPGYEQLQLDQEHLQAYAELLAKVEGIATSEQLGSLHACIKEAIEMQTFFAEAFTIFESGEFEPIKDFMQKEEYIAIRDGFMAGTMEYWDGETYIPVTREKIQLMLVDGKWKYSFPNYEEYPEAAGMIQIWSAKQEDDGVQRLCISYEPALENGEYYPHTTYEFIYLYSNVRIKGVDVPQMNYRFETRVATPEGTTTQVIGDWGGEHEFDMEF
ncbi:MAG: tetratricopeptide repeat protein [Lachnospiraceae bacterium]|nr:tetratricopeptide repeat protein [Lachnospiraceae bacterium]